MGFLDRGVCLKTTQVWLRYGWFRGFEGWRGPAREPFWWMAMEPCEEPRLGTVVDE
jgi:hypothetical protein